MTEKPLAGVQIHSTDIPQMAAAFEALQVDLTMAHIHWGDVEKRPGRMKWEAVEWWDRLAETGVRMPERIWTLYAVHMHQRGPLPPDLKNSPWDTPEMSDRFEAFIEQIATRGRWREGRPIILIGNEVDMWAGGHPNEIEAYVTFTNRAADAVKRHAPNTRIINTFDASVLGKPWGPDLIRALNEKADLLAIDWYDLKGDFTVAMSSLEEFIGLWKPLAPGKPILINEIGLPTSAACDSSEDLQAQRINELFDYLEKHTRDEVEGACWLGLDDWDPRWLKKYVKSDFGPLAGNEQFFGFLSTLGIRTFDGTPKEGFRVWEKRAAQLHS